MGQKVNPTGFRLPVNRAWRSRWFAPKKTFGAFLVEDQQIREYVKKRFVDAGLSKILIERYANRVRVSLFSARPGVIIGRKGQDVDRVRQDLEKMTKKEVYLEIKEVRVPDCDAQLVAESIAQQLEKRIALKRAMKRQNKTNHDFESASQSIKVSAYSPVDLQFQVYYTALGERSNFLRYALFYGLCYNRCDARLSYVKQYGDETTEPYALLTILGFKPKAELLESVNKPAPFSISVGQELTKGIKYDRFQMMDMFLCPYRFFLDYVMENSPVVQGMKAG